MDAIATDKFLDVGKEVYECLPPTGEHDLFDRLLRDVTIVNGLDQEPFRADLGINFSRTVPTTSGGTIVDLGDLHVTSGKIMTHGGNYACLPGRIVWLPDVTPSQMPNESTVANLLAEGVTTVLGQVNLDVGTELADLQKLNHEYESPINIGFLAKLATWSPDLLDRLLRAISQGVLAVLSDELPTEVKLYLSLFSFPIVPAQALPIASDGPKTIAECATLTQRCASALEIEGRGAIRLGEIADLIVLKTSSHFDTSGVFDDCDLHRVIVAGNVVFENGSVTDSCAGEILTGPLGRKS